MSKLLLASEAKKRAETVTIDEITPYIDEAIKKHKKTCKVPTFLLTEEIRKELEEAGYTIIYCGVHDPEREITFSDPRK